jgi:hypothetical protein
MKNTVRIAWMVAGTLILTRIFVAIIDGVLWYLVQTNFRLSTLTIRGLNLTSLVAFSFAVASTGAWWIEHHWKR